MSARRRPSTVDGLKSLLATVEPGRRTWEVPDDVLRYLVVTADLAAELRTELARVVEQTDEWNSAVEAIIGRQPRTGITLERARELICL